MSKTKTHFPKNRVFAISVFCIVFIICTITFVLTYGDISNEFIDNNGTNLSGVIDNVVYINEIDANLNYFKGLNYTQSNNGTLPTGVNQNIYSNNNLVQLKITYSSLDPNNNLKGYISTTELQDTFIYYQVYAINNNNTSDLSDDYIEIELIDNPFINRPINKGFNGWKTNYNSVTITHNADYYMRTAKIPVTYTNGIANKIEITFNASWVQAAFANVNNSSNWTSAFNHLDNSGMKELVYYEPVYGELDMTGYFYRVTIRRNQSCTGYYNQYGTYQNSCTCSPGIFQNTCTYYERIENETFDENNTYYELSNGAMSEVDNDNIEFPIIDNIPIEGYDANSNMAGYFRTVNIARYNSIIGYYDSSGNLQTSGTCNTNGGCIYYELIQYYKTNGEEELLDINETYYYLVTRDTNIIVMTSSLSTSWAQAQNKPFTLTSVYNGNDYRNSVTWNVNNLYVICRNDTTIENIRISGGINYGSGSTNTNPGSNTTTRRTLYANWHNVKLGRGILQNGSYVTFTSVIGGLNNNVGSSTSVAKYRLMIESGYYTMISLANGTVGTSYLNYIETKSIYGNDYDRAVLNNNNLMVSYCASGSWGGRVYASTTTGISFDLTVKSGQFGTNLYDNTTGIYIGGRYGGTHYTSRKVLVQGGWIYNLIGGPLTANNRSSYNDTYLYMVGGEVDMITGGAGQTATYGNRIVQVTGGTVNYSVFGGSNGYDGDNGDGTVVGSSFMYIGGNATIGNSAYVNNGNTLFGAEAGSVFGIGNGRNGYSTIGSSDNSNIIIADDVVINNNVFGGGNYGAVGVSSNNSITTTNIDIIGGTIKGSVYGGGNNNGAGDSDTTSTINIIMTGGNVEGAIYGGSKQLGVIYGSANVTINGGTVQNVYGGGQGGYASNTNQGTFVSGNISVIIGDQNLEISPTISGSVYGGSAFGTVNSTTRTTNISTYKTNVTVNKGTVENVFGGGQGNETYTPYVAGNVEVTINNGTINNVYGGNDLSGTPNGSIIIYLNGGTISNTYGGGNQTDVAVNNIYLQGATSTNIFGGSNQSGTVNTSNITTTSGTADSIYGGNNIGGTTIDSNVTINGGMIGTVYGGGKYADITTSNVSLLSSTVTNVYGGGERASVVNYTHIVLGGAIITNIYGGSNILGRVPVSNIDVNSGTVDNIYGGNNEGGTTETTNITVVAGNINNIYGGGNFANTTISNIEISNSDSKINNIYGGGKSADVTTTNINITGGSSGNVFGGSDQSGTVSQSNILINNSTTSNGVTMDVLYTSLATESWQSTTYPTVITATITLTNTTNVDIDNWNAILNIPQSTLYSNYTSTILEENNGVYRFNQTNQYYGINSIKANSNYSFTATFLTMQDFNNVNINYSLYSIDNNGNSYNFSSNDIANIDSIYGGNNEGGITDKSNIDINSGIIGSVYGGGNHAITNTPIVAIDNAIIKEVVYGGGNQAGITNSTSLVINSSTIEGNVFGGGNAGIVLQNTNVNITDTFVKKSIYAGGNGTNAVVYQNTTLNVDGNTIVGEHVFGGGNAAATGLESNNSSTSVVNIAGANISGNVYGGANTSVLYGTVELNIGSATITENLKSSNIKIGGTVFGGGEANASGDENYDYSFISVTTGITINIDGKENSNFEILGSIFGSGNASSTTGYSLINIKNYGTAITYQKNISIQRADIVSIDNSFIELQGATDRTNEYSTTLFTLSRIDELRLKNNSTLFLETGANLVKSFYSLVDVSGTESLATVLIDENGTVTKNVDNRIYMYDGKNLNIATNEAVTAYGTVNGMTFFGMYIHNRDGNVETAYYSSDYVTGSPISSSELYTFSSGSYVLGMHKTNHDIKVDGFYTNYAEENNLIKVDYIQPTPEDSNYYMWVIGEAISSYDISLVASKYSTLGTYELSLINQPNPNTIFTILGFNYYDLPSDFDLVMASDIPRISADGTADTKMSLVMETSNTGWITRGETTFLSNENNSVNGTIDYQSENSTVVPSLLFYLYHSKNLQTAGNIGTVTISLIAVTPIDDLTNHVERININVELSRALYTTNDYEGAMSAGSKYSMFASTAVDITSTSTLSAYYSLFVEPEETFYKEGYYHTLVSSFALPVNTKITMIDFTNEKPEYYYYVINQTDYDNSLVEYNIHNEVSYKLSNFIRMGSPSQLNNYDDAVENQYYYDSVTNTVEEEFIFIVDFEESNIHETKLGNTLLIELRNADDQTMVTVLGIQHANMTYNLYENKDAVIDIQANLSDENIYIGDTVDLNIITNFVQQKVESYTVFDTKFLEQRLGIKITIHDENDNIVNGASLLGVEFEYNNKTYYPRVDGTIRIPLAERVANVSSKIKIKTTNSNLSSGLYSIKIESFGSADGIYYGLVSSDQVELSLGILNNIFGLSTTLAAESVIIDKITGKGNNDNNALVFKFNYSSGLANPNLRVSLYRRNYDEINSMDYTKVNLLDYVTNNLIEKNEFEYLVIENPLEEFSLYLYLKENLVTGTYKMVFSLYDNNTYIGEIYQYIIIK